MALDLPNDGVLMKVDNWNGYPLNSGAVFDNEKKTMQIETFHGDKYLFDFTTGNIISSSRPTRNLAIELFCVLLIIYFVYVFSILKFNFSSFGLKIINYSAGLFLALFSFFIPVISVWFYNKFPLDEDKPIYPEFVIFCLLQTTMLPRYLLTSLNIFAPFENNSPVVGFEAVFKYLVLFWLPLTLVVGFINHFFISKLSRNNFK